ncbi:hypothetical protein L915_21942 [Phytophthora nicotianae]|uniref:DDE-1 domain-containing protein n=2 Tax=Phytophthora nicotianae TaxID=4792 RepID=W2FIW6_PHYNI|nr:hypothetical protein L915_21942 [Phytophthora nicotianae]
MTAKSMGTLLPGGIPTSRLSSWTTETTCMGRSSFCGMTSRDIGPNRSLNTLRQSTLSFLKSHHAIHMYVKVVQLQEKPPRMAFEMVAPKRHEITAWIAESWSELSADTIVSGFAKTELLTDTRSPVVAKDHDKPQDISDVLNQLADLGVADETGVSGDELFSSDSSDNE